MTDDAKRTVEMPPEFTAQECDSTADYVQYRIDRCIERDGSREAAITGPGMGLGVRALEMIVHSLTQAATEIRALAAARQHLRPEGDAEAMREAARSVEQMWQEILDKDDRNSPEEYPDMVLLTFGEFKAYVEEGRGNAPIPATLPDTPSEARKFPIGCFVRKVSGSQWEGRVVGFYSTELTPVGYAVESLKHRGSVQIYPEGALAALQEPKP